MIVCQKCVILLVCGLANPKRFETKVFNLFKKCFINLLVLFSLKSAYFAEIENFFVENTVDKGKS